jgi:hypothetical protein
MSKRQGRGRGSGDQRPRPGAQRPRATLSGRPRSPGGQPVPAGQGPYTPGASGTRMAVERSSARPLIFLRQLPWWLPLIFVLALMITGFVVPGWIGAVALVLVAAFLAWLAFISWPRVNTRGRLLRVVAVASMLTAAVVQALR